MNNNSQTTIIGRSLPRCNTRIRCGQPVAASLLLMIVSIHSIVANAEPFDFHSVRGRTARLESKGRLEGELHFSHDGKARVQPMASFGTQWSGNSHLLWDGSKDEQLVTRFSISDTGTYRIGIRLTKAPDYGLFSVKLDGDLLHDAIDLYSNKVEPSMVFEFTEMRLNAGEHELSFKLVGANDDARPFRKNRYLLGLDYLQLDRTDLPKPTQTAVAPANSTTEPDARSPAPSAEPLIELDKAIELLNDHCLHCHGPDEPEAGIDLSRLAQKPNFIAAPKLTDRIVNALSFHAMPPKDEAQPDAGERQQLIALFNSYIAEYASHPDRLPPIVMRRMNRYEYNNSVRDLLQLRGDIYPLPEKTIRADTPYFDPESGHFPNAIQVGNRTLGKNQVERQILSGISPFAIDLQSEHGFNNRGDELSISPLLLESFLKLGQSIVESPEFDDYCELSDSLFGAPLDTPTTDLPSIARERLRPFLRKAFRSPVTDETLNRYSRFFSSELERTTSFRIAMKRAVAAILSSPRFIYLAENSSQLGEGKATDSYELATRLSFFLWSTIPDDELLTLAEDGALRQPHVLRKQITRMLEDPRSQAISTNFARQWLRLDQLITAVPDFDRFTAYYSRIGCEQWKFGLQTMLEPLLLFESIMVEDRSIMLLVDSNYSYRSDELQSWYSETTPFGNRKNANRFNTNQQVYRKRMLTNRREGGVITTAGTMTMTSSPLRTKPITRGAWVANVVFNNPPPPPPDVIPEIEADDKTIEAQGLTLRQRLKQHQVNQTCVSCHQKIDPLGFVLENYDAVGRWRDKYQSGLAIDSSGELFGHSQFTDIVEFKDAILKHPEWFIRAFCEHLLSYALGRSLDVSDKPAVDRIVQRVVREKGKFSTVVIEIATSYPFLNKR